MMMVLFALMGFGDVLIGGVVVPEGNKTSLDVIDDVVAPY